MQASRAQLVRFASRIAHAGWACTGGAGWKTGADDMGTMAANLIKMRRVVGSNT